jgi:small multidrug resistance pump
MSWFLLAMAIITEVIGTVALKFSAGFTNVTASVIVFTTYIASFVLLGLCLKTIELGVAYAIWAGVGTALIAIAGLFLFDESVSTLKMLSIALIIMGVVGLNLANGTTTT